MSEPVTPEDIEQLIDEVSAFYTEQIVAVRRAGTSDPERLEVLKQGLAACVADRQALHDASAKEAAEIAARYAARARELRGE
ncbi:hypothetical protein [Streptomyces cinereoruber]|uniref:hypothetical protein n=1 Tax=Streptomyces cinereoruber TaxID=67260 RepID=UPI0036361C29